MQEKQTSTSPQPAVRVELEPYTAELSLTSIPIGIDNIHYDVFLSPRFVDQARKYILDQIKQTADLRKFYGSDTKAIRQPETGAFKKLLTEILQAGLTRAKFEKNIELDMLLRLGVLKLLSQEIGTQFGNAVLECKEWIRSRGEYFERSEKAHVLKAQLAELQGEKRRILRLVGLQLHQMLQDIDDTLLGKSRKALFGDDYAAQYEILKNRLIFVEGGRDDHLFLEFYTLLGNFQRDPDRFENIDALLMEFLRESVSAGDAGDSLQTSQSSLDENENRATALRAELIRLEERRAQLVASMGEGEGFLSRVLGRTDLSQIRAELSDIDKRYPHLQGKLQETIEKLEELKARAEFVREEYQQKFGDFLNQPENARRLFDPNWGDRGGTETSAIRAQLLDGLISRLESKDLLLHILASYELRNIYLDYCPPLHLQQLKRALVFKEEQKLAEDILKQFPAKQFSLHKIVELSKSLRRYPQNQVRAVAIRFAEDFMRLRRDMRNAQKLTALMERINLIRVEKTRDLSRINNSLNEFPLPDEARPVEDRIVSHAVIKADVRGSTQITQDLLARGMNPASHFSLNFYEPVKRILDQYGAFKVFLEGDAIILAIYETEANRAGQRAVAKACLLAREMLAVSNSYNSRAHTAQLPRLEIGLGIAFQGSPPTIWADGDSKIMISRALNLSDRLSSCSKVARRMLADALTPFNLFLFQTVMEEGGEEEIQELLVRYNMNGIELNGEGFHKLSEEISLTPVDIACDLPWGTETSRFYFGEVPMGERIEQIIIRKGLVRQLLPGGKIGDPGTHAYYEVCTGYRFNLFFQEKLERMSIT